MVAERCDECRFDGARWTDQDVLTTLGVLGELWDGYLEGAAGRVLHTRPKPDQWSIAEYTGHLAETLWAMRFLVAVAREAAGRDLGEVHGRPFDPEPSEVDLEAARPGWPTRPLSWPRPWPRSNPTDGQRPPSGSRARWSTWGGSVATRYTTRPTTCTTSVASASPSGDGACPTRRARSPTWPSRAGGVPKHGVERIEVGWSGAMGDRQGDRRHHGRPFQALCLWSADTIAALRAEGHPIEAGLAGENVTVAGIDWAAVRPGRPHPRWVRWSRRSRATPRRAPRTRAGVRPMAGSGGSTTTSTRDGAGSTPRCCARASSGWATRSRSSRFDRPSRSASRPAGAFRICVVGAAIPPAARLRPLGHFGRPAFRRGRSVAHRQG